MFYHITSRKLIGFFLSVYLILTDQKNHVQSSHCRRKHHCCSENFRYSPHLGYNPVLDDRFCHRPRTFRYTCTRIFQHFHHKCTRRSDRICFPKKKNKKLTGVLSLEQVTNLQSDRKLHAQRICSHRPHILDRTHTDCAVRFPSTHILRMHGNYPQRHTALKR